MAKGVNKVILLGNLGADPEIKHTPNGTKVARARMATSESYKDKNGEWKEETEWHNLILWGYLADNTEKYLKKGSRVYIEGKLSTKTYEKDGSTRFFTEVRATNMVFLDGKQSSEIVSETPGVYQLQKNNYPTSENDPFPSDNNQNNEDEDIPF